MTDFTEDFAVDRRTVLRGVGSLALAGAAAGCTTSTDGGNGGGGGGGGDGGGATATQTPAQTPSGGGGGFDKSKVDSWLSGVSNYDGIVDRTGQSEVTVEVGVQANGGAFGFGPAAVKVSPGTTVKWKWTGDGGSHNVVDKDGDYESDLYTEAGVQYQRTFDSTGVSNYFCRPHKGLGMKGSIIVAGDGGGGGGGDGGGQSFDKSAVDNYLSGVSNYDAIVDKTGSSNPTVMVGADGNGGDFAFKPAAIKVSKGTTVTWEWTGDGGSHNVVHEGGTFESKLHDQSGVTFEYTFESTGVYKYFCRPHKGLGMKGVVVVV